MIELFEHNKTAYEAVLEQLADTGRTCVIHPTGTGKSFIAFKWIEDNPNGRFVWISPSENIYSTQLENVRRVSGFEPKNVTFLSFERLMMMSDAEIERLDPTHAVIDEFHRAGAERWAVNVQTLLDAFPSMQVLGLSATPVRYLDDQRDMADELFDNCIADQMNLGEAIARGILPAPKYVVSLYCYTDALEKYASRLKRVSAATRRKAEEYLEQLRRALDMAEGLNQIFARHMRRGRYIVFCANREHMEEMLKKATAWFRDVDAAPRIYSVWADSSTAKADYAAFKADESDHLRLLYCIDMFNEGVHVDGLDGVVLLRPTISPIIYKQQIGRALSAVKGGTPVIFDVVNNFENLYSISSVKTELQEMVSFYRKNHRENEIVTDDFEIIDEVRDCGRLFAALEETLGLSWEMMYREARAYYEAHGDLDVPNLYRTDDNVPLGKWIQTQRSVYNGTANGLLTPERIALLNKIGMIWENRSDRAWENGFDHAQAYRRAQGHLSVPAAYVCDDGYRLGAWLANLRQTRKRHPENDADAKWRKRYQMLEALGMAWETCASDEAFQTGCREAERYAAIHGSLEMPVRYTTESGFCLGEWIVSIRRRYRGEGQGAPLTQAQIERLEAIGIRWQGKIEQRWEQCFEEAKRYYASHGDLNVPVDHVQNGVALWKWLTRQVSSYRKGKLDPERAARLEAIGIRWKTRATAWDENLDSARRYFQLHGDLEIPPDYVADNGVWLGKWLASQRAAREKGELSEFQISRLNALGMRWENMHEVRWKEAYEAVCGYIDSGVALDSLPRDAKTSRGTNLYQWVQSQRKRERAGRLSPAQSSMLQQLSVANQQLTRTTG